MACLGLFCMEGFVNFSCQDIEFKNRTSNKQTSLFRKLV